MTNEEIKRLIHEKEAEIETVISTSQFVLNKEVMRINNEIAELRKKCTHTFNSDGICIYCGCSEI